MTVVERDVVSHPPALPPSAEELRRLFLLDPDVAFLNHGSFGACPAPVFAEYQHWQRELERQPVAFLQQRSDDLLDAARARLAAEFNCAADDLVFVPNCTVGLNIVIRSLDLRPGDEILTTNHEYGALNLSWEHYAAKTGAQYIHQPIPTPVTTHEDFIETFWSGVTDKTRVIFLSHITSPTALTFPIAEICRRARERGIFTMIDGAHVPGQRPIDLQAFGADCYSGNLHKWLCTPKGSGFLHVRPEHQPWIEAMTVSWGWDPSYRNPGELTTTRPKRGQFASRNQWQGTRDLAAFLAVPAALDFLVEHQWDAVRERCFAMARAVRAAILDLFGTEPLSPDSRDWFRQLVAIPIRTDDPLTLKARLLDEYNVEVPILVWNGQPMVRVSVQGYVTENDLDRLVEALKALSAQP